jgi:hypothetical protein
LIYYAPESDITVLIFPLGQNHYLFDYGIGALYDVSHDSPDDLGFEFICDWLL